MAKLFSASTRERSFMTSLRFSNALEGQQDIQGLRSELAKVTATRPDPNDVSLDFTGHEIVVIGTQASDDAGLHLSLSDGKDKGFRLLFTDKDGAEQADIYFVISEMFPKDDHQGLLRDIDDQSDTGLAKMIKGKDLILEGERGALLTLNDWFYKATFFPYMSIKLKGNRFFAELVQERQHLYPKSTGPTDINLN